MNLHISESLGGSGRKGGCMEGKRVFPSGHVNERVWNR